MAGLLGFGCGGLPVAELDDRFRDLGGPGGPGQHGRVAAVNPLESEPRPVPAQRLAAYGSFGAGAARWKRG